MEGSTRLCIDSQAARKFLEPDELPGLMKLLPTPPRASELRTESKESLGHGMDAALVLVIFLGLGWGLDTIFGTIPLFMIIMTVFGAIGVFARFYYSYSESMDRHDANRLAKLAGNATAAQQASNDAEGAE